jgi:class 3 adenylate cyclase
LRAWAEEAGHELTAEHVFRDDQAELTILFADLRGYTALSRTLEAGRVQELLDVFYDQGQRMMSAWISRAM